MFELELKLTKSAKILCKGIVNGHLDAYISMTREYNNEQQDNNGNLRMNNSVPAWIEHKVGLY